VQAAEGAPDIRLSTFTLDQPWCSPYAKHLSSYRTLIDHLVVDEDMAENTLKRHNALGLQHLCKYVLCSIDTRILHCLIRGDLPRQYQEDPDMKNLCDRLWQDHTKTFERDNSLVVQPGIYINYIADRQGDGLDVSLLP
jgi:hypothetical protein